MVAPILLASMLVHLAGDPIRFPDQPVMRGAHVRSARADTTHVSVRGSVLIGAGLGALTGAALGLVVTRDVAIGCKATDGGCNARRTERNIRIGVTAATTVLGSGLGAVVGLFVGKSRH
jgi:hypothetical protein